MSNYTLTTPSYTHTQEIVKRAEGNNIQRLGVTAKDQTKKETQLLTQKYSSSYKTSVLLKQKGKPKYKLVTNTSQTNQNLNKAGTNILLLGKI